MVINMPKNKISKSKEINNCLALFDEQFTIADLHESFDQSEKEANGIIAKTKEVIYKATTKTEKSEEKYVVQMNDDLKKRIDSGEVRLVKNKAGELLAQTRNSKGQFDKKLPIKKELQKQGISTRELEMALQMEAIKGQLENILDSLESLEGQIQDVIKGQRGDRIGLYYSGFSLYIESKTLQDQALQKELTAQALKSLSDANSQIIQDLRDNLEYLINREYEKKKDKVKTIDVYITAIRQCYDMICKSYFVKAMIYQDNHELQAMLTTIHEYGRFVEKLIIPYVGELHEFDRGSKMLDSSSWKGIANTLTGCEALKEKLLSNNSYLLTQEGVKYEN